MAWLGANNVRGEQDLWGLLFEGDLRLARTLSGSEGPLVGPLNNTRFALLPQEGEVLRRESTMRGNSGSNLSVRTKPTPTRFGMAFNDAGKTAFELALRGVAQNKSQTGAAASGVEIEVTALGSWYKLPHAKLAAAPTFAKHVEGEADIPLVVGDDDDDDISAEIDTEFGYFFVRAGSANLAVGDIIKPAYSFLDLAGFTMDGDSVGENIIRAEFSGVAQADGIGCRIIVRRATVTASGELNVVGNEFPTFDFVGDMSQPPGGGAAYTVEWWPL